MTKPIIRIHDLATDQVIDREMTVAEYDAYLVEKAKEEAAEAEMIAKAEEKAALLERLGITQDEAKLLLG